MGVFYRVLSFVVGLLLGTHGELSFAKPTYFTSVLSEVVDCSAPQNKGQNFNQNAYDVEKIESILESAFGGLNFLNWELVQDLGKLTGPFAPSCREIAGDGMKQNSFCRSAMAGLIKRYEKDFTRWLRKHGCLPASGVTIGNRARSGVDVKTLDEIIATLDKGDLPECRQFSESASLVRPSRAISQGATSCSEKEIARCVGDTVRLCRMSLICPPGSALNPISSSKIPEELYTELSCVTPVGSSECPTWRDCHAQSVQLDEKRRTGVRFDLAPAAGGGQ